MPVPDFSTMHHANEYQNCWEEKGNVWITDAFVCGCSKAVTLACSWQVITAQDCILICTKSDILFASISRAPMSLVVVVYIL